MITFENVHIYYGQNHVIKGVSFTINDNEIFGIIGHNGAGKTTLLRAMVGIIAPDKGRILVNGVDPAKEKPKVAMLFETTKGQSFLRLTPVEDLEFYSALYGVDVDREKIYEILKTVGLYGAKDKKLYTFSRGMWQRQFLARVLLPDFPVIVLDEPWLGLDVSAQRETVEVLKKLKRMGKTIVLTAHEMPLIERVCDRIMLINKGKKITEGSVRELLDRLEWKYEVSIVGDVGDLEPVRTDGKLVFYVKDLKEFLQRLDFSRIVQIDVQPISLEEAYLKLLGDEND